MKCIQSIYKDGPLFDKKTYNWKLENKSNCLQKLTYIYIFLDIITLMLLAKFEFDTWFHFFKKNKEISKNRISPKT